MARSSATASTSAIQERKERGRTTRSYSRWSGSHRRRIAARASGPSPETSIDPGAIRVHAIVPVGAINLPAQQALAFAQAVASRVTGVHVTDDLEEAQALQAKWHSKVQGDSDLVIIESPYRSLVGPLLTYLDGVREEDPDDTVLVVLP